ncbi:helix-turn-helix domain-containing protein [Nocardia sp. NPDC052001]|uniref:TetR/AcrR family transcriptional regulator n=1 Tax=Nocardia sp. NPDC052001 TaxID=3154853 RepID=UPI003440B3E0
MNDDLSTRQKLLTVAERLLLESGFDAVSVRAINAAAGMNPASVHYHFGSKEALVAALLEDRLGPIWRERLDTALARRREGWIPSIAELIDVVVDPLAELAADPVGRLRLNLLARVVLGGREQAWSAQWFVFDPWVELLLAVRPELSEREAAGRWGLAFTLILEYFGDPLSATPRDRHIPVTTLKSFVAAGLVQQ